eukprot:5103828-Prymnesium_polylepis.1
MRWPRCVPAARDSGAVQVVGAMRAGEASELRPKSLHGSGPRIVCCVVVCVCYWGCAGYGGVARTY